MSREGSHQARVWRATKTCLLLPQCRHRIDSRRSPRRTISGKDRGAYEDHTSQRQSPRVVRPGCEQQRSHKLETYQRDRHADREESEEEEKSSREHRLGPLARMLGANIEAMKEMAERSKTPVIASGGVTDIEDVKNLAVLPLLGIIIGRAIYEKTISLADALRVVAG